ncbi:MAG: single-stranded-DNA-specific exonuclease RecJ [Candidatus Gracilibacteria bacterium]
MSLFGKKWVVTHKRDSKESLWSALMLSRNITDPADFFSDSKIEDLPDPFLFKDMQKSVDRILKSIKNKERIAVYSDYDVDGISGGAILVHTLNLLGADVSYRIPHRQNDGYGLHQKYIEELAQKNVKVLITVDVGISCAKEINLAKDLGIDVIITDHHAVPKELGKAFTILHPILEKNYKCKHLSGSAVAFKLASALLIKTGNEQFIQSLTDLATLGIVADCVPLTEENRTIVKLGLKQMGLTKWDGLKELLKLVGAWDKQDFSTFTIGFQIGPRLNASGRMDNPYWAMQTLLATKEQAPEKSKKLDELNKARQESMIKALEEAEQIIIKDESIIIAESTDWNSGIVGLIAGRLQEKYQKPTFIMEDAGDELVGSIRSVPGFSAVLILNSLADHLMHYGGHEMAGGFRIKKSELKAFKKNLKILATKHFKENPYTPIYTVDTCLTADDFLPEIVDKINSFSPFGQANPKPIFLMENVEILETRPVGKSGNHLKCIARFSGKIVEIICFDFSKYENDLKKATNLLVYLDKNVWNGTEKVEARLVDAKQ